MEEQKEQNDQEPQIKKYWWVGVIFILALAVGFGFLFLKKGEKRNVSDELNQTGTASDEQFNKEAAKVIWMQTQDGWQANTTSLPACPNPVLETPVELTNVTSILYPGQTRGGQYKPHGGFRFDNVKDSNVTVMAPMDAVVVEGSRYLVNGEIQYTFDFIAPCGMMYRFGHLLNLDTKYQKIADTFPPAQEMDSRTTRVDPQIDVKTGETIATAIGITKGGLNVFFDFGVYNLLTKNEASQDAVWAAKSEHDPELAQHAVCWLDLLPSADATKVKSLPGADGTAGKTSDFCK